MDSWHFWNISNSLPGADGISIKVVSFSPQQEQAPQGREGWSSMTGKAPAQKGFLWTDSYSSILKGYAAQRNITWEYSS